MGTDTTPGQAPTWLGLAKPCWETRRGEKTESQARLEIRGHGPGRRVGPSDQGGRMGTIGGVTKKVGEVGCPRSPSYDPSTDKHTHTNTHDPPPSPPPPVRAASRHPTSWISRVGAENRPGGFGDPPHPRGPGQAPTPSSRTWELEQARTYLPGARPHPGLGAIEGVGIPAGPGAGAPQSPWPPLHGCRGFLSPARSWSHPATRPGRRLG